MEWITTQKRFVCFLDIMGFKDLVARSTHAEVYDKLAHLKEHLDFYGQLQVYESVPHPKHFLFSDSILLVSPSDKIEDLREMANTLSHFLYICIKAGIPIKGALSFGELTADFKNSIFFGQALIDAYLLQEELALYGVILDNHAEARMKQLNAQEDEVIWRKLLFYPTPTKSGAINHYAFNWVARDNLEGSLELVKQLYNFVSGRPRLYVDNTIKFTNQAIENKKT